MAWKLCTTMKAGDVTDTLELALEASGCAHATVRLLSDNGSSYVAAELADYLEDKGMDHVRGARLVAASDSRGCASDPGGLDIAALAAVKARGGKVTDLGRG